MLGECIGRALRFAAPVVAAVTVFATAGAFVTPAPAGETPPCTGTALEPGVTTEQECADPAPPPTTTAPTVTTTFPVGEPVPAPPTITAIVGTTTTTPTETATTPQPPIPDPEPAKKNNDEPDSTTATATATPTRTWSSGSILGTRIAGPPQYGTPKLTGGPYVFPVIGRTSFTDTWGAARATVAWHHGVDIFAPFGSPVVAVADGALFSVGWNTIGGRRLWLRDGQGNYFYYAHLSAFARVAVDGARVRAGTVVGYVGDTGDAAGTPPHLHFEVHPVSLLALGYDGAVNPFPYVSSWPPLDGASAASVSSAAAPTPGAILLGFTDISSADDLSDASVEETLDENAVAAAVQPAKQLAASAPIEEIVPPPGADDVRIARSLDAEAAQPASFDTTVWDALAECESSGNWSANTGNGFVGGLQFLPQTWSAHGGATFAPLPNLATREQQIAIAERVLDTQGWNAWPACSTRLGLRTLADR